MPLKLDDIYMRDRVWIWVRLHGHDLEWDEIGDSDGQPEPEWLSYELQENGLDMITGIDATTFRPEGRLVWLLEQGLAPEQPFLLEIGAPVYSTDYWGETDWEIHCRIVKKEPWDELRSCDVLEAYLKRSARFEREDERARILEQIKVRRDLKSLIVQFNNYVHGESYDWNRQKLGTSAMLQARRSDGVWGGEVIATARSDSGSPDECLRMLLLRARLEYPQLTLEKLKALPRRWV